MKKRSEINLRKGKKKMKRRRKEKNEGERIKIDQYHFSSYFLRSLSVSSFLLLLIYLSFLLSLLALLQFLLVQFLLVQLQLSICSVGFTKSLVDILLQWMLEMPELTLEEWNTTEESGADGTMVGDVENYIIAQVKRRKEDKCTKKKRSIIAQVSQRGKIKR